MEKHSVQFPASTVSSEEILESNAGSLHVGNSIPRYSEQEAGALAERLVKVETFREAQQVLITWLERGECKETNYEQFYFMIELCSNHFKKLLTDQKEHLEGAVRESLLSKSCDILNGIEEVFNVIEKRDIWGNFTQNQIENMQEMRKNVLDLKQNASTDGSVKYERMEIEEDPKIILQAEIDTLTNRLNATNQATEDLVREWKENKSEILKLKSELEKTREMREKDKEKEMHIISLLSIFLNKHPEGVNIGCISTFLNSSPIIPTADGGEIEGIMRRNPRIFKESLPSGDTEERKWFCISLTQETLEDLLKSSS